jgi:ribosomal protein L23
VFVPVALNFAIPLSAHAVVMPKVWFPQIPLQIMPFGNHLTTKGVVHLRTTQNQTKVEIKNYLSKVYGVGVIKVNTMNYRGKLMRDKFSARMHRKPKYKKAVVTVDNTQYLDLLNQQELAKAPRNEEPL